MRREGKIYEHSVDNVILRDPPLGISPLWTNLQRMLNPQPQPCPGEPWIRILGSFHFQYGFNLPLHLYRINRPHLQHLRTC